MCPVSRHLPLVPLSLVGLLGSAGLASAQFTPILEWSWTSSAVEPTALNVMMTPSVVDLNGDGVPDVVFASTASTGGGLVEVGFLRALNGNDGSEIFTVTDPEFYARAKEGAAISIRAHDGVITLDGKEFRSEPVSEIAHMIQSAGGIVPAVEKHGRETFDVLTAGAAVG